MRKLVTLIALAGLLPIGAVIALPAVAQQRQALTTTQNTAGHLDGDGRFRAEWRAVGVTRGRSPRASPGTSPVSRPARPPDRCRRRCRRRRRDGRIDGRARARRSGSPPPTCRCRPHRPSRRRRRTGRARFPRPRSIRASASARGWPPSAGVGESAVTRSSTFGRGATAGPRSPCPGAGRWPR